MRGPAVELPAAAQSKLTEIGLARDAAMDAMRGAQNRINTLPPFAEEIRGRLAAERDKHAERHRVLAMLVSRLNQFHMELRLAPGTAVEPAPAPEAVKLKPHINETVVSAITQFRRDILRVQQEIASVRRAPLKKTSRQEAVRAYIAWQAQRVGPKVTFDVQGNARVMWAEDMVANKDDLLGVLAWVMGPEKVLAAFSRDFDAEPEARNALTVAERQEKVAELSADLLRMERIEESLIMRAASDGTEVLRRPDASPLAVLGIVIGVAKEAQSAA
jgi:hypothetical protein